MRWFKHDTDASDDIKIKRLEEKFGIEGYSTYFKTLEILGKDGKNGRISFEKYPKKWISGRCYISEERLSTILKFMGDISLCCPKSLRKNQLYITGFRKRADDYTKRVRRLSEHPTKNVHLDKNRTEENKNRNRIHMSLFEDSHLKETGVKYLPAYGRDKKILYDMAEFYDKDTLNALIEEFFRQARDGNAWHSDKLNIPVFRSVVAKLIGGKRK